MDPREYAWQMGDLADPYMSPDERYMQPPPRDAAWPQQFLPSPGDPAKWQAPPTQLARWPGDPNATAPEAAAEQTRARYRNALSRDPNSNQMGALAEMIAPQSPLDYALLASGPVAKAASVPVRAALYGGAMALDPGKAEAMLAGPRSKTANLALYKKAEEMLLGGRAGPEIRKETNWFPTAGSILKYEISDKGTGWVPGMDPSNIPKGALKAGHFEAPAEAVYRHPAAYEAYPELRNMPVIVAGDLGKGVRGGFDPPEFSDQQRKVWLAPDKSGQMRSVFGHEALGHAVQDIEYTSGWSGGGNPKDLLKAVTREGTPQYEIYQNLRKEASKSPSFEEYADMLRPTGLQPTEKSYNNFLHATKLYGITGPVDDKLRELAAHTAYRNIAGEAEARAIQARMNLGPRQIKDIPFEQSLDVPYNQQFIAQRQPLKTRPGADPSIPDPEKFGMAIGDLADASKLQLSAKAPTGFVPGSVLGTGVTRASPQEITRAAAESRKGMTQPELRALYDELGLTGGPPSELVRKSLAGSQPAKLVEEATQLKLADREVLNTLSPEQRLAYQKTGKLPSGLLLPSQDAALPALEKFLPIKKEVARAEKEFDKSGGSKISSLFDLSPQTLNKVPNVEQYPLPRVAPKATDRLASVAQGGLQRIERAAAAAPEENWGWYNLMQQRDILHKIHGPEKGEQVFQALADTTAGTSMVNPIDNNIRSSTWYLQQLLQGKPLPEVIHIADPTTGKMVKTMAGGPPPGYGAKSQIQHADRVREFLTNTYDPVTNPKPISYRTNLSGNYGPRTVDTHDIRNLVGMPRSLKLFSAEDSALLPGEYTYLEDVGGRAAKRAGTPQAQQQAATWIGGGEYTGLKSFPAPLQEAINRRAHVTAKVLGITPEEALHNAYTGKMPLLGLGGAAVMGGLAAQNEYRQ